MQGTKLQPEPLHILGTLQPQTWPCNTVQLVMTVVQVTCIHSQGLILVFFFFKKMSFMAIQGSSNDDEKTVLQVMSLHSQARVGFEKKKQFLRR